MNTKSLLVALSVIAGSAVVASSQAQAVFRTNMSMQVFPQKARYARGEVVTVVYTVTGQINNGTRFPLAGVQTNIGDWWPYGWTMSLFRTTNHNGQVSMTYRVPTNPFLDNINLVGFSSQTHPFPSAHVSWRIPIGR